MSYLSDHKYDLVSSRDVERNRVLRKGRVKGVESIVRVDYGYVSFHIYEHLSTSVPRHDFEVFEEVGEKERT